MRRSDVLPVAEPVVAGAVAGWVLLGHGPALAATMAGLGLAVSMVRLARRQGFAPRLPAPTPALAFAATFALHAAAGLWYTSRLRVSGDEPHYLVMAQSLWREGDLDLRDNYAREDWREHTPGPLRPHYAAPRKDGRPFPAHSPGLPLLLALPYALARRPGTVAVLVAASAAAAALAVALARRLEGAPWPAFALAAGPPMLFYGFHVYTEGLAAAALAAAAFALIGPPTVGMAALAAGSAVLLPWLHLKMTLAAAFIGGVAVTRWDGRPRAAFIVIAAAGALAFGAYYASVFGSPSPLAIYGGVPRDMDGSPVRAVLGLLLDRSFGLLPWAPVFAVALAGLPALARRGREGCLLLGLAAAAVVPALGWRMWWGGQCPPARFLVPVVPMLAVAASLRVAESSAGLARWWPWLALISSGLALRVIVDPGQLLLLNRGDRPTRLWELLGVNERLPSFVGEIAGRPALVWTAALVVLLAFDAGARRDPRFDRAFRWLGIPAIAFALLLTA